MWKCVTIVSSIGKSNAKKMSDKTKVEIKIEDIRQGIRTMSQLENDIYNGVNLNNTWMKSIKTTRRVLESLLVGADKIKFK